MFERNENLNYMQEYGLLFRVLEWDENHGVLTIREHLKASLKIKRHTILYK